LTFCLGAGSTFSGTAGVWAAANYPSATGAVSVVGTSGATFYITGVQLEKGSVATGFDYRSYGTELGLCQRYYTNSGSGNFTGYAISAGVIPNASYKVTMRATPTMVVTNAGGTGTITIDNISTDAFRYYNSVANQRDFTWTASADL